MKYRILTTLHIGLCFICNLGKAQNLVQDRNASIVVEIEMPAGFKKDRIYLDYVPYNFNPVMPNYNMVEPSLKGDFVKWEMFSNSPLVGYLGPILGNGHILHLYEPGDSIHIDFRNRDAVYSGKGSEKLRMLQELKRKEKLIAGFYISGFDPLKDHPDFYKINSLKDYQKWSTCLDKQEAAMDSIFGSYKDRISPFVFGYVKAEKIVETEYNRLMKFHELMDKSKDLDISGKKLGQIFDATANNKYTQWLHAYTGSIGNPLYLYDFVRKSVQRKYDFNLEHDNLKSVSRKVLYVEQAKKDYRGEVLQSFLTFLLTEEGLKEHLLNDGSSPEIEKLLHEFYAMPGYPGYKDGVKAYEQMIREWCISIGSNAPDFSFNDQMGNSYHKKDFIGKLVFLNFFDNSIESMEMLTALKKVEQLFKRNPNVVFLNVSTETAKSAFEKVLFVEKDHPVLKYYNVKAYPEFNVSAYPKVFLLDGHGQFVYNGEFSRTRFSPLKRNVNQIFPDPRKDHGQTLVNDIYKQLARMKDGPYVFHGKDKVTAYNINSWKVAEEKYPVNGIFRVVAQTDDSRRQISIQLKEKLVEEPSVTATRPEKLFVLSDIEGEFEAFRKLLQANKIIDEQFNWTFGKGHLVFAGDMFDRGQQVTECLWLVYALEEKAKKAGGYVHFVLGNHEIMNLQGDHGYVDDKYKENAKLMGKTMTQLYNEDSELGRWLRTKNIVEKIGNLLFMHGGFSQELNNQLLSIARPFYADTKAAENTNPKVSQLYKSTTSPFWYRLYYKGSEKRGIFKAKESQIDSTLQNFNVNHIITGHTIVADTITTHYNNKVINTDTKHRAGKSEGLLVEGKNFYRVNAEGKRVLLFREEEK